MILASDGEPREQPGGDCHLGQQPVTKFDQQN